jgi:hypothetical protein
MKQFFSFIEMDEFYFNFVCCLFSIYSLFSLPSSSLSPSFSFLFFLSLPLPLLFLLLLFPFYNIFFREEMHISGGVKKKKLKRK